MSDRGYRDARQLDATAWCARTFGKENVDNKVERARRFIEEAVELVQAAGLDAAAVTDIVSHVYSKPAGQPAQEAGGVGITLLILCERFGLSADDCERRELARVVQTDPDYFRKRHATKVDAGISQAVNGPTATTQRHPRGFFAGI